MEEQLLTELEQRFTENSPQSYMINNILKNKSCNQYTFSDGTVYVGKAKEALYNPNGNFLGFSKGIPFVRTTKKRHESKTGE